MDGKLIIFSAPSGSGKTTIVRHLLSHFTGKLAFSVSATTRQRRENEIDGQDYYFLELDDFRARIAAGEFAEWEEVYPDNYYGTLKSEIQRLWDLNKCVLFDVDVKGGLELKRLFGAQALAVFVRVSSEYEIRRRLSGRGTETEESLERRLAKVRYELSFEDQFDVVLVNDDLAWALRQAEVMVGDFVKNV